MNGNEIFNRLSLASKTKTHRNDSYEFLFAFISSTLNLGRKWIKICHYISNSQPLRGFLFIRLSA